jgi:hypothetical protein
MPRFTGKERVLLLLAAALVASAFAVHVHILVSHPVKRLFGDERTYLRYAGLLCTDRFERLLPGRMIFELWPPFAYSFHALVLPCGLAPERSKRAAKEFAALERLEYATSMREHPDYADDFHFALDPQEVGAALGSVAWANLALLLALSGIVFAFCLQLGAGAPAAALGAALIAINPRLGFHVSSLWPELLHAVLLSGGMLGLCQAVERSESSRRLGYGLAATSGLLIGYATLTKGVAGTFFGLVSLAIAGSALWRLRSRRRAAGRLLIVLALFVASAQAVVLPQRLANRSRLGAPIIATNFWLNVEVGLKPEGLDAESVRTAYFGASRDYLEREALSRARVRDDLSKADLVQLGARLAAKLAREVTSSFLAKRSAAKRWDGIDEDDLRASRILSLILSCGLVAGAGAYALLTFRFRFAELLLLGFVVYYFAGLLAMVGNERMFVQAIPPLTILTASLARRPPPRGGRYPPPSPSRIPRTKSSS